MCTPYWKPISYQGGVGGVELRKDVSRIAEHGGDHRPLGREVLDDVARDEDGRDDQEEVDDGEGGRADALHLRSIPPTLLKGKGSKDTLVLVEVLYSII